MKSKKYIFKSFLIISIIGIGLFNFPKTHAATTAAELQDQIDLLLKQVGSLQGTTGTPNTSTTRYNFTTDLQVGSQGADVTALQNFLIEQGYLAADAVPSKGYFGQITKAALIKFQTAKGITAAGVFGPMTRAAVNAMSATPGLPAGSTFTAGFDSVTEMKVTTPDLPADALNGEGVLNATATNNKITLKATDGDVKIETIKVDFDNNKVSIRYVNGYKVRKTINVTTTIPTDSDNFEIAIGETTIEFDKDDIEDNIYSKNDLNIIIQEDEVQEFSIVDATPTTTPTTTPAGTLANRLDGDLRAPAAGEIIPTPIATPTTTPTTTAGTRAGTLAAGGVATIATATAIVAGSVIGETIITYTPNENFDPNKAYEKNTTDAEGIYYRTQNSSGGYDYFATDVRGGNSVQITFTGDALNGVAHLTGWVKVQ